MCFEERKTPLRCMVVLSALACVCGIIMIVFAYLFVTDKNLENIAEAND